jgi:hypothetical protein
VRQSTVSAQISGRVKEITLKWATTSVEQVFAHRRVKAIRRCGAQAHRKRGIANAKQNYERLQLFEQKYTS